MNSANITSIQHTCRNIGSCRTIAMLIYGARNPAVRPMALAVAGASKAIFIAVVVDAVWVGVFAAYLVSTRRTRTAELNVAPAKTP